MASLKALVPRVVKIQTRDRADTAGDGSLWWKQDRYIDFKSRHALRWLGRNWLTWRYQKFPGSYLKDASDVVRLLQELSSARLMPPLTDRSRVFEGGANLGRNLLAIQNAYRCEVVGIDVSPRAVEYARERVWKHRSRWEIFEGDVLTSPWFTSVPDKAFDLALTRWHLIHIPNSSAKRAYVGQLRRISRTLLVLEPPPLRAGGSTEYNHGGNYVLSRDDWASAYDLKIFEPKVRMENTAVYYAH